jgi:hypothetical protein
MAAITTKAGLRMIRIESATSRVYYSSHPALKVQAPATKAPWMACPPPLSLAIMQRVLDGLKNL